MYSEVTAPRPMLDDMPREWVEDPSTPPALAEILDALLPFYESRTRASMLIDAPRTLVWEAFRKVTLADMPVARAVTAMRLLGASPNTAQRDDTPLLAGIGDSGTALVEAIAPSQAHLLMIGKPWEPKDGWTRPETRQAFVVFGEPGYLKAATVFVLEDMLGGTRITVETRNHVTDQAALHAFRRYWRLAAPSTRLAMHSWLAAVRRLAERAAVR